MESTTEQVVGVKLSGYGDLAWLFAIYPVLFFAAFAAASLCLFAAWRSRQTHLPLWFVFVGIVITMGTLAAENIINLAFSINQQVSVIPLPWVISSKALYVLGAGLHFWGAALALVETTNRTKVIVITTATSAILGIYIGIALVLR